MKIALIWGNSYDDKKFTVHWSFFEETLKDMGIDFVRYSWGHWEQFLKPEFDLYLFLDFDPCLYQLDKYPQFHPRAFFWFDCFHHSFAYPAQVTEMFDINYFAEKNVVDALNNQGLDNIKWLPPAFYEKCYYPIPETKKEFDFVFIGQPDNVVKRKGYTRKEFFLELQKIFPNNVIAQQIYGEEVNNLYNKSKILIDRTIFSNIGTRVFETIGSKGLVLVNKGKIKTGIEKLAIDNVHYVSYDDSLNDCINKINYYLNHEEERNKIALAGYNYFIKNHTYAHRLEIILKDFNLL